MSETRDEFDSGANAEAALAAAFPRLRRIQLIGFAGSGAVLVACLILLVLMDRWTEIWVNLAVVLLFLTAIALFVIHQTVRRQHEAEVMPIVADTFGIDFAKKPEGFLDTLPALIPPRANVTHLDDGLGGTVAGHRWRMAEVKTETGGKNSRVCFDGAVIAVQAIHPLPSFVVARHEDTRGSFWFGRARLDLSTLPQVPVTLDRALTGFGLWSRSLRGSEAARIVAFLDDVARASAALGQGAELCMIASDGPEIVVALQHEHDLFRIGGLFATRQSVLADIRRVAEEVGPVFRVVAGILKAQEALGPPPAGGG